MTTLSAGDLTNLRTKKHEARLYLSILQPATLLTAQVNNGSIARGARTIAYDTGTGSGFSTIAAGQTLEVDTSFGTEKVRVKSISGSQASGTITIAENGIYWQDNLVLRVKHQYEIWPVPPAIRAGIFYKDFDIAYSTQNSTPNPVAVIGSHLAGFLSAGSIAFSLNSSSSYAIAQGASISSRVWACVHNGGGSSGISFSSTTTANPTLTLTAAGTYWLSCTVTDSNGKTQITYRCIFVYDANNPPYQDFTIDSLSTDWDSGGPRCTITLTGDLTLADVPDEALAVIWYQNYFDGVEGYVNLWTPFGDNVIHSGYLWTDSDTDKLNQGTGQASFECITPLQYLDAMTDYGTVSLEAATSPANWSQYASWLTVGRGIHHLLKWDTTIIEACDVLNLTGNVYGVKVLEFTEDTVLQRIQGVAFQRGVHLKLLCNRVGQLYLSTDSQMLNAANRAGLDTIFTLSLNDISGDIGLVRNHGDVRAFADMDGFTYSHPTSAPFISMIPGYIEATVSYNLPEFRGVGTASDKQQVLNPAGGQTDCNERVGRRLALENVDPKELRLDLRGDYLGAFDIVPRIGWYEWGVSDNALKRQLALNGINLVCRSVSQRFGYSENMFNGTIQTSVVLQPEATGPDGIPGNYPTGYPAITTPAPPWTPPAPVTHFTTTYGYWAGGYNGSVYVITADRITFATSTTAANAGSDLSERRGALGALSDTVTYGYWAGGLNTNDFTSPDSYRVTADRLTLSTGITANHSASNLTQGKESMASSSDGSLYGYFAGGNIAPSPGTTVDDTDRITYSTGVVTANAGSNLSGNRVSVTGISDYVTYGYFGGGDNGAYVATTDRITFSNSITAANAGSNLSAARAYTAGIYGGTTYGYWAGGYNGSPVATADRITWSTSVTAANAGSNLSSSREAGAGTSDGVTYGYFGGGGIAVTTDRITLSTSITAANAGSNLSAARSYLGGFTDGVV